MKHGSVRLSVLQSALAVLLAAFVVALAGCPASSTGLSTGPSSSSSAKAITAFGFLSPAALGTVTEASHAIDVTVPFGTNVTALVAAFTTTGASVKVGSTVQASGTTPNGFTNPLTYTVVAADGSVQDYVVTVTVAPSSAKAITAFGFLSPAVLGTVTEANHTIAVTVPFGTNVTALVATFATTGASVKVGSTVQVSGTTANNFTSPVTYVVTAADSSTQSYTVTVTVQAASTNALLKSVALVDSQSTAYSLVPTFSSTTFSYTGVSPSFPRTAVTATLTVTPQDPTATITSVTETNGFGGGITVFDTHVGNVYAMTLTYYHTIVTIVLTAQDGVTTKTYSIDYILLFWRG
jgi:hypothetical protein